MSSLNIRWISFVCFLFSWIVGFSQSQEYNKTSAELILSNSCSDKQAYQTNDLDIEQPIGSCYGKEHMYGKWFKFKAEKSLIEIILKTGGEYGTTQFPYVYLWNESLKELACVGFSENAKTDFLTLVYDKLESNNYYYIQVVNHNNAEYIGTFTLCVSNKPSNDHIKGAVHIQNLSHWCTSELYTTSDGLPDEHKISCLDNSPNFNKWFYFIPQKSDLQIIVLPQNIEGDFQFPYLALFDENMHELTCSHFYEQTQKQGAILSAKNLKIDKKYFVSVDHAPKKAYTGSFQLCFDDKSTQHFFKFFGKLKQEDGQPKALEKVSIYDHNNTILFTLTADREGIIMIPELAQEISYIKTQDHRTVFEGLLLTDKNEIIKRAVRQDSIHQLIDLPENCAQLALLDCNNNKLKANSNKTALIGKVVHADNPMQNMKGVIVNVFSSDKKTIQSTTTDTKGDFYINDLPIDQSFLVHLSSPNHVEFYAEVLHINDEGKALKKSSSKEDMDENGFFHLDYLPHVKEKIKIKPIEEENPIDFLSQDSTIVLEQLFFRSNSSELMKSSEPELERVYQYLLKNPNTHIEVMGYTDNTGSDEINQALSSERAKSVVNSLVKKGIISKQLAFKGYGNSKPIADNNNIEGRMKNRRVEIRILP